jgi:uncharacterized protein YndB with AHSA1/START domain
MQHPKTLALLILLFSLLFSRVLFSGNDSRIDPIDNREVVETEVEASIDEVWSAFTTTSGLLTWCAPLVEINLKVGGKMRTNYDPKGEIGDANTIENTILCFDPKRMLSLKATKAPEDFPFPNAMKEAWSVIYFEEVSPSKTKITLVGLGYTDTKESKQMRGFFAAANNYALDMLKESFKQPAND